MDRQQRLAIRHSINRSALALTLVAVLVSGTALADGAREAVKAKPGEIVLLRNVSARTAYRPPVSPGMALLVDPSPRSQIDSALGLGELSDADVSALGATPPRHHTTVERVIDSALGNMGGRTGGGNTVASNGMSNVVGGSMGAGSMGALGNATSGIGGQVTGALSQLPMMPATPAGIGH